MKKTKSQPISPIYGLVISVVLLLLWGVFSWNISNNEESTITNEYTDYVGAQSICSELCLENPVNLEPHLKIAFTQRKVNIFYEPYFRDLRIYDYNKVEHKQCCLEVS